MVWQNILQFVLSGESHHRHELEWPPLLQATGEDQDSCWGVVMSNNRTPAPRSATKKTRCAIYTRVSKDQGLFRDRSEVGLQLRQLRPSLRLLRDNKYRDSSANVRFSQTNGHLGDVTELDGGVCSEWRTGLSSKFADNLEITGFTLLRRGKLLAPKDDVSNKYNILRCFFLFWQQGIRLPITGISQQLNRLKRP